jgi:Glycogen debranching enzyme, glucanotransferase domain
MKINSMDFRVRPGLIANQSSAPLRHRRIPTLPLRPRVHAIAGQIFRSYPVGRQSLSRACQGEVLVLTITSQDPLPDNVLASLVTTLNSNGGDAWDQVPFMRADARTLICRVTPDHPGLHSFRAEFSLDRGATWLWDTVPDAWILIDPPQVDGLRIYTLIPAVSGTVADWKADLTRIHEMGFNAVHLLPVTTLDTSESPYAAKDLFDIDHRYLIEGSRQDGLSQLEDYVEAARALDIRLCFDLVLNHVGVLSTMARRAPDWIVPDQNQPDGFQRARYWSNQGWRTWDDLVLINYEHPSEAIRSEIWAYMTEYVLFWAKYAHDTGGFVRFDNLHSSDPDFVGALTAALHWEYPEVGILAEYFTDECTLLNTGPKWGLNLNLATPWNYKFVPQLREYLNYIHRVSKHIRYFMPITSHDSGAPAQEFGSVDSTVPRYVAAALLGTGATGIPQGVEFGEKERINFIGRQPKMLYPAQPRFARFIGRVNAILAEYPAFRRGENCRFVDDGHPAVIAAFRRETGTQAFGFLVVCNFDTRGPQRIAIDLAPVLGSDGPFSCNELLTGRSQIVPHPRLELLLPPCAAQVLRFARNNESVDDMKP